MKKLIVGLILLGLASVANAAVYTGTGDWTNTANWNPAAVPTNTTPVTISGSTGLGSSHATIAADYTAYAAAITLEAGENTTLGGSLTVAADGILNATSIIDGKNSRLYNYGEINLTGVLDWNASKSVIYNYGTINAGALTIGNTMHVRFPGMLIIRGQDKTNDLQAAINAGQIESDGDLDLSYVGGNTFLKVSGTVYQAEGTVFQEGVSPTTVYDQGATYIRSGTDNTNTNFDADGDFELIVGAILTDNQLARGLLEFDLSFVQDATEIDSVSLILTTHPGRQGIGGTNTFNVHAYDSDIVETVSTWNDPDGDGSDVSGDATDGGTLSTLLASATFNVTTTGLTVTFSDSAAFRAAVTAALADDDILRLIVVNDDETLDTNRFARFTADSFGTPSSRPKLVVSHNWSTFQEGVAPDAAYTHHATFIHAGSSNVNFNASGNNIYVGVGASDVIRGLLKFDVSSIPSAHVIDEASLTFTTKEGQGGNNTFNLYAYAYDVDETAATWNAPDPDGLAPAGGGTNGTLLASATFDTTVADQKITFGDAAALRSAVAAALAGDGFIRMILANANESVISNFALFWDDEAAASAASNMPKLEVRSHLPPEGTVFIIQ